MSRNAWPAIEAEERAKAEQIDRVWAERTMNTDEGLSLGRSLDALERELDRLWTERKVLMAAVTEALEYFEDAQDVEDGDYGEPKPNREMRMAETMRVAILRATK